MNDDIAPPTYEDMLAAHERIRPHIHRTPVLTSSYFNELTGASLFFKCENLQKVGAFKARGACNAVFGLSDEAARKGVVTHSSGNHAGALSYAARRRGVPAVVVMPRTAPQAKRDAVLGYGARVVECEAATTAREAAAAEAVRESGADFVHPYDDARVIAGQGTCARELMEQTDGLDMVIAPIGGGGLISGACLALSTLAPEVEILAGEPASADDAARSLKAGRIIADNDPQTVADGLKTPLKPLTWWFVSRHVADILTAEDEETVAAMKLVWQRMKIVIEPSSAVPLAAMLKTPDRFTGKRVGIVLTGGNVDLDRLPWIK
ncbi:MAG: beta-hydroxyaspartate dehydratase BhcB [Paracoccaceae bacterium]